VRTVRWTIETVHSQLTALGRVPLHLRSITGVAINALASLPARAYLNLDAQSRAAYNRHKVTIADRCTRRCP